MKVDTIQLIWTHKCEHGVINGFDVQCSIGTAETSSHYLVIVEDDYRQIGPIIQDSLMIFTNVLLRASGLVPYLAFPTSDKRLGGLFLDLIAALITHFSLLSSLSSSSSSRSSEDSSSSSSHSSEGPTKP